MEDAGTDVLLHRVRTSVRRICAVLFRDESSPMFGRRARYCCEADKSSIRLVCQKHLKYFFLSNHQSAMSDSTGNEMTDIARDLRDQINEMRAELNANLDQARDLKQQTVYDNFKFFTIAFVCIFFLYIVVDSTITTVKRYLRNRKREREAKAKLAPPDDNEFESDYTIDSSVDKQIRMNIRRAGDNQNKELHLAKREKLSHSGKEINDRTVRDMKLEGGIDLQTFDQSHDEYTYVKPKAGEGFWDMLFRGKQY